jgi:hypothetical protein
MEVVRKLRNQTRSLTPEQFWAKVSKTDSCWVWTGLLGSTGYGTVKYKQKNYKSHRLAWFFTYGEHPDPSLMLRHTCDNPPCVNPAHLLPGTAKQNSADAVERNRQPRGETNGRSILTADQVREIRHSMDGLKPLAHNLKPLARQYGVDWTTVRNIVKGKIWRHLLPPNNEVQ